MPTRADLLIKDNFCRQAIDKFKNTSSVPEWLSVNSELFDSITIGPPGLPKIISFHFEDEVFEGIRKFGQLYGLVASLFEDEV